MVAVILVFETGGRSAIWESFFIVNLHKWDWFHLEQKFVNCWIVLCSWCADHVVVCVYRFESTVQISKLQDLVNRSKMARCRGRFVCPVILYNGKVSILVLVAYNCSFSSMWQNSDVKGVTSSCCGCSLTLTLVKQGKKMYSKKTQPE